MIQQRQRDIEYRETANDTRQRCTVILSSAKWGSYDSVVFFIEKPFRLAMISAL